jgi:hypothetical protein
MVHYLCVVASRSDRTVMAKRWVGGECHAWNTELNDRSLTCLACLLRCYYLQVDQGRTASKLLPYRPTYWCSVIGRITNSAQHDVFVRIGGLWPVM